jgi:hypothetical protein
MRAAHPLDYHALRISKNKNRCHYFMQDSITCGCRQQANKFAPVHNLPPLYTLRHPAAVLISSHR